jgi:glyoxylase-like metal-dependent hydrolase (beta-lactamase superfamily II)
MEVKAFFDERTYTLTYLVFDPTSRDAVVIDSVLDYDPVTSRVFADSAGAVSSFVRERQLRLHYILETHPHADHLSGSQILKREFPAAKLAIGARITEVQANFKEALDFPADFPTDGSQFDRLLQDGDTVQAGALAVDVLSTPGHTPACVTYRSRDAVFTGDAIFMPDSGTGRCDFPAGSPKRLYHSIVDQLYLLPDDTRVFVGHDYQPGGRELRYEATIGAEKAGNIQLPAGRSEDEFVKLRTERDARLDLPKLIFQSIQVNVNGGRLPKPAPNGIRYLKLPINLFNRDDAAFGV